MHENIFAVWPFSKEMLINDGCQRRSKAVCIIFPVIIDVLLIVLRIYVSLPPFCATLDLLNPGQ
jgi:hypothetical protein